MGRKKYTISTEDLSAAVEYIQRKLMSDLNWPVADNQDAAESWKTAPETPKIVNVWCEEWLDSRQWKQLKNSLLAARKRNRDKKTGEAVKHITLTPEAWGIISDLARHHNMTLSDFIIQQHQKQWEILNSRQDDD